MNDVNDQVMVECSETIDRPAEAVWSAVKRLGFRAMPQIGIGPSPFAPANIDRPNTPAALRVFMEQQIDEEDDNLMMMHIKMTRHQHLPWSSYQSRLRIESISPSRSRATVTCLATAASSPRPVEEMLRGMTMLALQSLKAQVENS